MNNKRNFTLDGMRGVAALAVVLYHLGLWTATPGLFTHGYLAVDFFFCLSGFVVSMAYGERLRTGMTFLQFALARMVRLYPVIFLGSVLGLAAFIATCLFGRHTAFSIADVIAAFSLNILLIPFAGFRSPVGIGLYPLNTPFWSLFFELLINFAWALVLRRFSPIFLYISAAIIAIIAFHKLPDLNVGGAYNQVLSGTIRVTLGFSAGMLVFKMSSTEHLSRLPKLPPSAFLLILALLLACPVELGIWYDLACAIVVFPALVIACLPTEGQDNGNGLFGWLGELSYPLYGIHRPICGVLLLLLLRVVPAPLLAFTTIVGGLLVAVLAGALALQFFDEPLRTRLNNLQRRLVKPGRVVT